MASFKMLLGDFLLIATFMLSGIQAGSPKRGLSYNEDIPLQAFGGSSTQITWQYNWGSSTNNKQPFAEYVPMLWNNYSNANTTWMSEAAAWLANGSATQHLLCFNEPELSYQANIPPAPAAEYYRQYMQPFANRARLGAPAVSNDGYEWLLQFLGNCTGCTIDFLPVHWYNPWDLEYDLEDWVHKICALPGNRPVWVTEFAPNKPQDLSQDQLHFFMNASLTFLDNEPCVARYAYFGSADTNEMLLEHGGPPLSSLGKQYAYYVPGAGSR